MINGTAVEESTLQFCGVDQSWSYVKDGESQILTAFRGMDDKNNGSFESYTAEGVKTVNAQLSI